MSTMFGILKSTMKYTVDSFDQTTAATDVVVIRHRDGTLHSSPFHVRFGRFKVVRPGDKCVQVEVNGELTSAVMKMGGDGLARWLKPVRGADGAVARVSSNSSEGIESPVCSPNLMPAAAPTLSELGVPLQPLNPSDAQLCLEEEVSLEEKAKYKELIASMADPSNTPVLTGAPQPEGRPRGHSLVLSGQLCGESPPSACTPLNTSQGLKLSKMASVDGFVDDAFASPFSPDVPSALLPRPNCSGSGSDGDESHLDTPGAYKPPDSTRADDFDRTPERTPAEDSESRAPPVGADDDDDVILDEDYDSSEYSDEDLYGGPDSSFRPQSATSSTTEAPQLSTTDTPPSSDLEKLNLKEGMNIVRYITVSALQGKVVVEARIYLWGPGTKICICDVDGTITKSDIMGHVMSMVGKDYTHEGICEFFDKVSHNGYQFLYLTARSVSHSASTRGYFGRIDQEGKRLPNGPLMTAPARFFDALTQEVRHRSHEFKIACLEGVRRAFPADNRPFYAGFGNRINDVVAYSTCGVPEHKVFIIDDQSVIHVCKVKQTYRNLSHLVNQTFPPLKRHLCVQQFPHRYAYAGMHSLVSDQIERDINGSCPLPPAGATPGTVVGAVAATAVLAGASVVRAATSTPSDVVEAAKEMDMPANIPPPTKPPGSPSSGTTASDPGSPDGTHGTLKMSWDGVVGHDGDEHDMDANFNSYNFWRCDPRDIVTPQKPVDATASKVPMAVPKQSERRFGNLWGLRGNSTQPTHPERPSSATSRSSSAAGGDTAEAQPSLSHTSSHLSSHVSSHRDPTTTSPPLSPTPHPVSGDNSRSWLFGWRSTGAKPPTSPRPTPTEGQTTVVEGEPPTGR